MLTALLYVLYAAFVPTVCVRFVNDLRRWWAAATVEPRSEEQRDRYFETFKHLTTLDVATAAFALALFRENEEGLAALRVPLVLFALSLLAPWVVWTPW